MIRQAIAGTALTSATAFGAHAHTTDVLHAHPHVMDLFTHEGAALLALMVAALVLVAYARRLLSQKTTAIRNRRGHR
jgi:hypothetical protein